MRATGTDPTNTPAAAAKRSASLSSRKREELAWQTDDEDESWTRGWYEREVLPAIAAVPLSTIRRATGLSISACSRIRAGKLIPHRRHWQPALQHFESVELSVSAH
jgi:predicted RNase H-like nuclease